MWGKVFPNVDQDVYYSLLVTPPPSFTTVFGLGCIYRRLSLLSSLLANAKQRNKTMLPLANSHALFVYMAHERCFGGRSTIPAWRHGRRAEAELKDTRDLARVVPSSSAPWPYRKETGQRKKEKAAVKVPHPVW